MSLLLTSATVAAVTFAIYWYMNRQKSLIYILKELKYNLDLQGCGAAGLIDDWVNVRRNKIVLPDASKRVAVITGGARGIGTEVIRGLLKANMIVVMGIRRPILAQRLRETMENGENLYAYQLDLQSLKSVKEFAENVMNKFQEVHLLVNNAGIMFGDYKLTEDGVESQLAVNYLSHLYLTHLLLPVLKKGGNTEEVSRVVNVSSCAHHPGKIFFDDINMNKCYYTSAAYIQSKLAQLMGARYVNKLLEEEGCPVRCYAVHPGIVNTDLFEKSFVKQYMPWTMNLFFKTPERGATSILYACFEKSLQKKGGFYVSNCIEGISSKYSKNIENQKRLFEISCSLLKINMEDFGKKSN